MRDIKKMRGENGVRGLGAIGAVAVQHKIYAGLPHWVSMNI